MTFYYTYGLSETQPFKGGWTCIEAEDMEQANEIFRLIHPNNENGFLNCAGVYREDSFQKTSMFTKGCFGHRTREVIKLEYLPVDLT